MKPEDFNSLSKDQQIFAHLLLDIILELKNINRSIDIEIKDEPVNH